jgi:copper resistance protein B
MSARLPPLLSCLVLLASPAFASAQDHSMHEQNLPPAPQAPPSQSHTAHDERVVAFVELDRLEAFDEGAAWSGHAWFGTDEHRLWVRSEGEGEHGRLASADLELLYARPLSRWWNVGIGLRHDFKPGAAQDFLAVGVQGTAPYKIEVQATAYLGANQAALRAEAAYDTLFTNRWILQSRVEANLYAKDDLDRGVDAGAADLALGFRLRYEITRQFAPYLGVEQVWDFGHWSRTNDTRVVAGIRAWF